MNESAVTLFAPLISTLRQKVMIWAMWGMLAFQGVIAAVLGYLYFEPPFMQYANLPMPVTVSPLHPGEAVPLFAVRCNRTDEIRSYNTTRTLVRLAPNDEVMDVSVLSATVVSAKPGCEPITSRINVLPLDTLPGRYRVAGKAQVESTFRTHWVDWYSQPFEVEAVGGGK